MISSLKIRGSARDGIGESSVPPQSERSSDPVSPPPPAISTASAHSKILPSQASAMEDIINVDEFVFPVLGNSEIMISDWVTQLKSKLRDMGANGYSIYNWPVNLVDRVLEHPLRDITQFEKRASAASKGRSFSQANDWKQTDEDGILNTLVTDLVVYQTKNEPLDYLGIMFSRVLIEFPSFRSLFNANMSARSIQDRLYEIYVGMWTAREFVPMLISTAIPSDYWHKFSKVRILAEFFPVVEQLKNQMQWVETNEMFTTFSSLQSHRTLSSASLPEISSVGHDIKSIFGHINEIQKLSPKAIQHVLFLQLIDLLESKLVKFCDLGERYNINLQKYESLDPENLLTLESATKIVDEMLNYARDNQSEPFRVNEAIRKKPKSGAHTHLRRLTDREFGDLRSKILNDTLSKADEEVVRTYSFAFKSIIKKKVKRDQELRTDYNEPLVYKTENISSSLLRNSYSPSNDSSRHSQDPSSPESSFHDMNDYSEISTKKRKLLDSDDTPFHLDSNSSRVVRPSKKGI